MKNDLLAASNEKEVSELAFEYQAIQTNKSMRTLFLAFSFQNIEVGCQRKIRVTAVSMVALFAASMAMIMKVGGVASPAKCT